MSRWLVVLVAATAVAGMAIGGATAQSAPSGPSCTASTKAKKSDGGRYNVRYRVSCDFEETRSIDVRTNKRISRVQSEPKIVGGRTEDAASCKRSWARGAFCEGEVGAGATIVGALKVKSDPCGRRKLRVRISASGGPDCSAESLCGMSLVLVTVRVPRPAGC